ncbi:MAG: hypothetical protein ACR2MO_00140, partial [Acidimicrobiales bacterium]
MAGTGRSPAREKMLATTVAAAVVLVLAGGIAFACLAQATLTSNPGAGDAGTAANVTGRGYQAAPAGAPVDLRWNGAAGALLAQAVPDENGNFTASVTVPADIAPGFYIISGIQRVVGPNGAESFVRPNAVFEVVGAPAPPPPAKAVVTTQPPAAQPVAAAQPAPAAAPAPAPAASPQP